jgi:hypothetical protein
MVVGVVQVKVVYTISIRRRGDYGEVGVIAIARSAVCVVFLAGGEVLLVSAVAGEAAVLELTLLEWRWSGSPEAGIDIRFDSFDSYCDSRGVVAVSGLQCAVADCGCGRSAAA